MSEFESWLGAQLKALETDDEVYLPYIVSILEDEDDKSAAIDDLLSGISDKEAENKALRIQILERWDRLQGGVGEGEPEVDGAAYAAQKAARDARNTQPDKAVKEAILAQYSGAVEESSGDESADGDGEGELDEMRNANAEAVEAANAEKREKARAAAAAKKDKDKEDREKQKKQAEDRKKKAQEKAAKGERRR